jgi:hypothetical protein
MTSPYVTSVILPTTATERAVGLARAVQSVFCQEDVSLELIVVANGPQCHREILTELGWRRDDTLLRRAGR